MKKLLTILTLVISVFLMTSSNKHYTIYVIGDSTAAEKKDIKGSPERGWAMVLQGCFTSDVTVKNYAINGRSSKSFIDEGRWKMVLDQLKPGDYVFIQFGHNDEKADPKRHTDVGGSFDANLRRYVNESRAKGATPVLFTAVARRCFYNKTNEADDELLRNTAWGAELLNTDTLVDTHKDYVKAPVKIAKEMKVTLIDANKITRSIELQHGVVGSRKLHMWLSPGEWPSAPKGRADNTHYNIYGAHVVSNAIATEIAKQIKPLRKYVVHYDYVVSTEGRGNFMTLQDAVNAVPSGCKAKILVLNGEWKSPILNGKDIKFDCYPGVRIY